MTAPESLSTAPRAAPPPETQGIALTFRALRSGRYRIFFLGQLVSLMGTWIQITALNWLVYDIGGSTRDLGLVSAAAALPLLPFSLLGGALADRISRKRFIMMTQILLMLQAAALTAIVWSGITQVWHIMALSVVLGAGTAMDHPARQAFVVQIIDRREDLTNAIALNATLFNLARTVGPAIAGLLVVSGGPALAFFVNALSYMVALWAISSIKGIHTPPPIHQGVWSQLADGFRYAHSRPLVREVLALTAVSAFFAMPFMTMMPAFAKDVLGSGPQTYGFLLSSVGLGAVAGGLVVASLPPGVSRRVIFPMGFLGMPLFILVFSMSRAVGVGLAFGALAGVFFVAQNSLANTILQSFIEDRFRGRVMSLYSLIFQGAFRTGALFAGELARHAGVPSALAIGAAVALLYGLGLLRRGAALWGDQRQV